MSFKLSMQLDNPETSNIAMKLYDAYIKNNSWRIPESALKIIGSSDWTGGVSSNAPYYSELIICELSKTNNELKLILNKQDYTEKQIKIEIRYQGVFAFDINKGSLFSENPQIWKYEQFLYFDAYKEHEIRDKMFIHQIEWVCGDVWSITARNIEVHWYS